MMSEWMSDWMDECSIQGSDTRLHTQKKPGGFLGYSRPKNPPQKTHTSTLT